MLDDCVVRQPLFVAGDSSFLGGGLRYILSGDEVVADDFGADGTVGETTGLPEWYSEDAKFDFGYLLR